MRIRLTQDHPRYARLREGMVVEAEPVEAALTEAAPELMRVWNFGPHENGAIVRSWELVLEDGEIEALLNGS